jgi:hypothetical protein
MIDPPYIRVKKPPGPSGREVWRVNDELKEGQED